MATRDAIAPQNVTALVGLNRQGIVTLAVTTALGAGIGACLAERKTLGAFIGGGLGFALPVTATLLILLPLKKLTLEEQKGQAA
jgi:hypothetical protein